MSTSNTALADRTNHEPYIHQLSLSAMLANLNKTTEPQSSRINTSSSVHNNNMIPCPSNNTDHNNIMTDNEHKTSEPTFLTATNDIHHSDKPQQPKQHYTINNTKLVLPHINNVTNIKPQLDIYPSINQHKKPVLLHNLRSYIQQQLSQIDQTQSIDGELYSRYQIYNNVLHMFAVEFTTYQSVLNDIQTQFATYINYLIKQTRDIEYYKSELSISQQTTHNKLEQQKLHYTDMINELNHTIEQQKCQLIDSNIQNHNLATQLAQVQTHCDTSLHQQSQLQQTNKTLVQSLKRYEQQSIIDEQKHNTLNDAYHTLKHDFHDLQTNYHHLIDELQLSRNAMNNHNSTNIDTNTVEYQTLKDEYDSMKQQLNTHKYEYDVLHDQYTQLLSDTQIQSAAVNEAKQLIECNTPRPHWRSICTQHNMIQLVPSNVNQVKSTNEYINDIFGEMNVLLNELNEYHTLYPSLSDTSNDTSTQQQSSRNKNIRCSWLKCLGDDDTIPKYLRSKGKIRNRILSKRETELFIKEIWSTKYNSAEYKPMSMIEYMYVILKHKYTIHDKIIDYSYNFIDALDHYSDDPDCRLLLSVLNNIIPESLYTDQLNMLTQLQAEFNELDIKINKKQKYRLSRKVILDYLRTFFDTKSDENMKLINIALYKTDQHNDIHYLNLFSETREGDQTQWLECIREQHINEVFDYTHLFYDKLRQYIPVVPNIDVPAGHSNIRSTPATQLTIGTIRQIFNEIDPDKNDEEISSIVVAGLRLPRNDTVILDDNTVIHDIELFITNCSNILIKRSGKVRSIQSSDTPANNHPPHTPNNTNRQLSIHTPNSTGQLSVGRLSTNNTPNTSARKLGRMKSGSGR